MGALIDVVLDGAASMAAASSRSHMSALIRVVSCLGPGYAIGNAPIVRDHFWSVALVILAALLAPLVMEVARARVRRWSRRVATTAPPGARCPA